MTLLSSHSRPDPVTEATTTTTRSPEEEPDLFEGMVDVGPYWMGALCRIKASNNIFVRLIRKYLDFTSYYITIAVAVLNTLVMCVLAKHLWRAYWIKVRKRQNQTKVVKAGKLQAICCYSFCSLPTRAPDPGTSGT